MVVVEFKATEQRFTINKGRIVDGDMQYASIVKVLAEEFGGNSADGDPDYFIAQEIVALHGGRIIEHNDTDFAPDVIC